MPVISANGFFSYAHADDAHGKLKTIRDSLCEEYAALTGDTLNLFFDRNGLEWGDKWEEALESGVDQASFFIPILSPRYFQSVYCQKELRQFLERVRGDSIRERLVLPILYIDIRPSFVNIDPEMRDEILAFQFEDWTNLRFASPESEEYQKSINRMVNRIISENEALNTYVVENGYNDEDAAAITENNSEINRDGDENTSESDDGQWLDDLVGLTDESEALSDYLIKATGEIKEIGNIFSKGTDRINHLNRQSSKPRDLLSITRSVAAQLDPVAKSYELTIDSMSDSVYRMDANIRRYIPYVISNHSIPEEKKRQELDSLIALCGKTKESKTVVCDYLNKLKPLSKISRVLTGPIIVIQNATNKCLAAFDVILEWESLIEE